MFFSRFKSILIFTVIFLCAGSAFSEVVDTFDSIKSTTVKERGDFAGGGRQGARIPFVKSKLAQDPDRGPVLQMDFNVSQGYGGTYLIFKPGKVPQKFNTVSFFVRGTNSTFKVEVKDDAIHSFIVEKADRSKWQKVSIPVASLSNAKNLKKDQVKEFVFVFEDHRSSPRLGSIYADDLAFTEENIQTSTAALVIPQPITVKVESKALNLSNVAPANGQFKNLRFEASWDGRHWFYLAEFQNQGQKQFDFSWNIKYYPSGPYFLRAVTTDEFENRKEGTRTEVELESEFNTDAFLDEVQKHTFDYFVKEVDQWNYLVKDRTTPDSVFSTGLSGFQFTAYVIGVNRGWMERSEAIRRMNLVLDFLLEGVTRYHGLVPHWLRSGGGEVWEIGQGDVVETSFILAGALTAQQYFNGKDPEEVSFRSKVDRLYQEIKWSELLKRDKPEDESGLLPWLWSKAGASKLEVRGYNEAMFVYLLGLGAPTNTLTPKSWQAWRHSYQRGRYGPYELIACAPLFTHQYSHLWVDLRNVRDDDANYFENSILATLANREFSIKANGYPPEIWGLTASEGPNHYKAYGAPPVASSVPVINDGTIAPTAAGTSMMFTPQLSIAALRQMREQYGSRLWGPYGFKDAFNPRTNWYADVYLGLDQGPLLIGIENYRTGLIWNLFMKNPYIQKGLAAAGFRDDVKLK